jgi:hypothetical protein
MKKEIIIILLLILNIFFIGCSEKEEFELIGSPDAIEMSQELEYRGKDIHLAIPKIGFYSYRENKNISIPLGISNNGSLTRADIKLIGPLYGDKDKCDSYFSIDFEDSYTIKKEKLKLYNEVEKEYEVSLIYIDVIPNEELQKELCFYNLEVSVYAGSVLKINKTLELTIDIE